MHLTGQQSVNKRDMKQLTIENFKAMLDNALKNIKEREDEFSKLDAVIGDGDHGQAIVPCPLSWLRPRKERSSKPC